MPKRYPPEQRERAVRMVLDHLDEYRSVYSVCQVIGPKLVIGESLRDFGQASPGRCQTGTRSEHRGANAESRKSSVRTENFKEAIEIEEVCIDFLRVNVILKGSGGIRSFLRCPGLDRWLVPMCGPTGRRTADRVA